MTYQEWFENHAKKHQAIVTKLQAKNFDKEKIIAYFEYDNISAHEPDFCLLFAQSKKCHDIPKLNCYMCACPYFMFDDDGLKKSIREDITYTIYSQCTIGHKKAKEYIHENAIHLDCSDCSVPHSKSFIEKHFDTNFQSMFNKEIKAR